MVPRLLQRDTKRLRRAVRGVDGADDPASRDLALHAARKKAERLRFAAESAIPVLPRGATKLASGQGDPGGPRRPPGLHGARGKFREYGAQTHLNDENGFTFGRLHALEQARGLEAEHRFEQVYGGLTRKRLTRWTKAQPWMQRAGLNAECRCPAPGSLLKPVGRQFQFPTPPIVRCPRRWRAGAHARHGQRPTFFAPRAPAEGGPFGGSDAVVVSPPARPDRRRPGEQTTQHNDLSHTPHVVVPVVAKRNAHRTNNEVHLTTSRRSGQDGVKRSKKRAHFGYRCPTKGIGDTLPRAAVTGSGIMAGWLSHDDVGLQWLEKQPSHQCRARRADLGLPLASAAFHPLVTLVDQFPNPAVTIALTSWSAAGATALYGRAVPKPVGNQSYFGHDEYAHDAP